MVPASRYPLAEKSPRFIKYLDFFKHNLIQPTVRPRAKINAPSREEFYF